MEQLKFSIGPYELFSSIIGGIPILISSLMLYSPLASLRDIIPVLKNNSSISIAVACLLLAYIFGGLITGASWNYFKLLSMVFRKDYRYFGTITEEQVRAMEMPLNEADVRLLEFDERLKMLLVQKIGVPRKFDSIDVRLMTYLRGRAIQCVFVADSHQATHIMYRGLSFGLSIMAVISTVNIFRLRQFTFEQIALPAFLLLFSHAAFLRSVSFKRWHNRELMLGFYYHANET